MADKKNLIAFQVLFLVIAFAAIEIALRLMGYEPGDLKPKWFNFAPVDTLIVSDLFYTNADGILIANRNNPEQREQINSDGFRSKEFSEIDTAKKKIMFIGDSFTWGFS